MTQPQNTLKDMVAQVRKEEKTGYVNKESLLCIVMFRSNHTLAEVNADPANSEALQLLAKYHMLKLVETSRYIIPLYIQRELTKTYQLRCSRCGCAVTNKEPSDHVCK